MEHETGDGKELLKSANHYMGACSGLKCVNMN